MGSFSDVLLDPKLSALRARASSLASEISREVTIEWL
jgi:hypothetical protein